MANLSETLKERPTQLERLIHFIMPNTKTLVGIKSLKVASYFLIPMILSAQKESVTSIILSCLI